MITLTRTYTRPSVEVKWHPHVLNGAWVGPYINSTYKDTGKLLFESMDWSNPEALTIDYTAHWVDMASFEEYNTDATLIPYWEDRNVYNETVGITISPQVLVES